MTAPWPSSVSAGGSRPGFGDPGRVARIHVLDAVADGEGLLRVDAVERAPTIPSRRGTRTRMASVRLQPGHELEGMRRPLRARGRCSRLVNASPPSPWRPRVCVTRVRMTRVRVSGRVGEGEHSLVGEVGPGDEVPGGEPVEDESDDLAERGHRVRRVEGISDPVRRVVFACQLFAQS